MHPSKTPDRSLAKPSKITQALWQSARLNAIGSAGRVNKQSHEIEQIVESLKAEIITPETNTPSSPTFSVRVVNSRQLHQPIDSGTLYTVTTHWRDFLHPSHAGAPPSKDLGGNYYAHLDDERNDLLEVVSAHVQSEQIIASINAPNEQIQTPIDLVICQIPLPKRSICQLQTTHASVVASVFSRQATEDWVNQNNLRIFPSSPQTLPVDLYRLMNGCLDWGSHSKVLLRQQENWVCSELLLKPCWSEAVTVQVMHTKTKQLAPIIQQLSLALQSNSRIFSTVAIETEELQNALTFFETQIKQSIKDLHSQWINGLYP